MAISIVPLKPEHAEAVKAFNLRISTAPAGLRIDESPKDHPLAKDDGSGLYREHYLALDGGVVHGGYIMKRQPFYMQGRHVDIGTFQLPISEGIVDSRYGVVGVQLLEDALARQPQLFCLGMGGFDGPLPRLLTAMRWRLHACPFYFFINRPFTVLRNLSFLRKTPFQRTLVDFGAFSGLGYLGIQLLHMLARRYPTPPPAEISLEPSFGAWADEIWELAKKNYVMIATRDQLALNRLYDAGDARYFRLKFQAGGKPAGWALLLDSAMQGHKQFGNLRVGSIVDCLALPGMEERIISGATRFLLDRGVDLIVSNQLHSSWASSFKRRGYLSGPSNFVFAVSPELQKSLEPYAENVTQVHMTRGDGDGPIHL
ncbi:MAG: hypothetical protein IIA59_01980 [Candidatus Marinimicrobia bacterium]|nr:hypothetical protein [Candidatus Neomarinimicrobiota bacterium]